MDDRIDLVTQLNINLQLAERIDPAAKERAAQWLFNALLKNGYSAALLNKKLENKHLGSRFWFLRQLACDRALRALNAKLTEFLETNNGKENTNRPNPG